MKEKTINMKKTLLMIAALSLILGACRKDRVRIKGVGPVVTETRNATFFDEVHLQNSIQVIWHHSADHKIEVEAQRNIAEFLLTEQDGHCIKIKYKPFTTVKSAEEIIVHLYSPQAKAAQVSGSGKIELTKELNAPTLELDVSGSGQINLNTASIDNLEADISGSGRIKVMSGELATSIECKVSGSGRIEALERPFKDGSVKISGSGRTELFIQNNLSVNISGSGKVLYKGNPNVVTQISGSGRVVKM